MVADTAVCAIASENEVEIDFDLLGSLVKLGLMCLGAICGLRFASNLLFEPGFLLHIIRTCKFVVEMKFDVRQGFHLVK